MISATGRGREVPARHALGETGAVCGYAPFQYPEDFAVTTDQEVTCRSCLIMTGELKWEDYVDEYGYG